MLTGCASYTDSVRKLAEARVLLPEASPIQIAVEPRTSCRAIPSSILPPILAET